MLRSTEILLRLQTRQVVFYPDSPLKTAHICPDYNGQTILPAPLSPNSEQPKSDPQASLTDRRRIFKQIIVKCVLQLLLIETTNDLLRNNNVYTTIPPEQLLRLMGVLDHSYQFARMFNDDKELRTGLWKVGTYFSSPLSQPNSHWLLIHRIHETLAQSSQTRIQQRLNSCSRPPSNVLRHKI